MDLIANIGTVVIIWYGGRLVIDNQLTLGELVAFTTYLAQLVPPVRRMGMIIPVFAMALSAGERIFEISGRAGGCGGCRRVQDRCRRFRAMCALRMSPSAIWPSTGCCTTYRWRPKPGQVDRPAGRDRLRQVVDHQPDPPLLRPGPGPHHRRRARPARRDAPLAAQPDRHGAAGHDPLCRHHRGEHRLWPARRQPTTRSWRRRALGPGPRLHHRDGRRLRHRRSASGASPSPAGRSSASPSPAPCSRTRAS